MTSSSAAAGRAATAPTRLTIVLLVAAMTAVQALATLAVLALAAVAPAVGHSLGLAPVLIGYQVSVVYGGAVLCSMFTGSVPRRLGAVRTSQLALLLNAAGCLLAAIPSLTALGAGSFVIGLCYGLTNPAAAQLLARVASERNRNLIFSLKQTGVPLGGIAAGLLVPQVTLLLDWRWALAFIAAASLLMAAALQGLRARWDGDREQGVRLMQGGLGSVGAIWRMPGLRALASAAFFFAAIQLCLMTYLVTLLVLEVGLSLVEAGALLALVQASGAVGRVAWGWLADRTGDGVRVLLTIAAIMIAAALGVTALSPAWPLPAVAVLFVLYGFAAIGWNGVFNAETARRAPAGQVGSATAGVLVFAFFGVLLGPASFAIAFAGIGRYTTTYGLLAVAAAAGLAFVWRARQMARDGEGLTRKADSTISRQS